MSDHEQTVLTGVVVEQQTTLTIDEMSRICKVRRHRIVTLVNEGILDPAGPKPAQWHFPASSLQRAKRALRIKQGLEINMAGVAVVLDLLDEIDKLQAELARTQAR